MVSDCLAQLTFMSSAAMAQWLLEQLGSDAATCRGVAVAAVKHVMHDGNYAVPELAQCATISFMLHVKDRNVVSLGVVLLYGQNERIDRHLHHVCNPI